MIDVSKLLTVREAARRLDLTEERVRELIGLKQIRATKIRRWRIAPEDLSESTSVRRAESGTWVLQAPVRARAPSVHHAIP